MIPYIECPECESTHVACLDRDDAVYYCQECGTHFDHDDDVHWSDFERDVDLDDDE